MITELNWQPLAERRRIARLVMFYKIHYQLVAITMPLELKSLLMPTLHQIIQINKHHLAYDSLRVMFCAVQKQLNRSRFFGAENTVH